MSTKKMETPFGWHAEERGVVLTLKGFGALIVIDWERVEEMNRAGLVRGLLPLKPEDRS